MPYHSQRLGSIYIFKEYKAKNKQQAAEKQLKNNKNTLFSQVTQLSACIEKNDLTCVSKICQSMLDSIPSRTNT